MIPACPLPASVSFNHFLQLQQSSLQAALAIQFPTTCQQLKMERETEREKERGSFGSSFESIKKTLRASARPNSASCVDMPCTWTYSSSCRGRTLRKVITTHFSCFKRAKWLYFTYYQSFHAVLACTTTVTFAC